MPHIIEWFIPGRVLSQRIFGDLTIEDMVAINRETNTVVLEEGVAPIHSIVDLSGVGNFPKNLSAYKDIFRSPEGMSAKLGWYIIVAPSPLLRFITSVAIQVAGVKMRTFPDRESGEAFLRDQDSTLQSLRSVTLRN